MRSDAASHATARNSDVPEDDAFVAVERRAAHARDDGLVAADVPRGAHVRLDDPLLSVEHRAVHARKSPSPVSVRVSHPEPGSDPVSDAEFSRASAAELREELIAFVGSLGPEPPQPPAAELRDELVALVASLAAGATHEGTHERQNPIIPIDAQKPGDKGASISEAAPHDGAASDGAVTAEAVPQVSAAPDQAASVEVPMSPQRVAPATTPPALASERQGARATARRRWRLVPIAGAAAAVAAGIGGGTAVAYIVSQGSGTGQTDSGAPVAVTIAATAGTADLLPGQPGAVTFTLHNPASAAATLNEIIPGVSIVSNNTALCASSEVRIAPGLPYTLPSPITVAAGATSSTQSIPGFVTLASDAPSACQGVTFSVSFTLSGKS